MPAAYSHDVFGRIVLKKAPKELKNLLSEHQQAYRIGLQGPDILFYYRFWQKNGISRLGHLLHEQPAADFFESRRKYLADDEKAAYILGFLCHFMLDSACHPYIARAMEIYGVGHDELETELDRALLLRTGKDPLAYHTMAFLVPDRARAERIAEVIGASLKGGEVTEALWSMRLLTGITVCGTKGKYALLSGAMDAVGVRDFKGHLLGPEGNARCGEAVSELEKLLLCAAAEAADVMRSYWEGNGKNADIPARLCRNYE